MSLLHGAKKHFILAVVFVLSICSINVFKLGGLANAASFENYAELKKSAIIKTIVGYVSRCFTNDFDVNTISADNIVNGIFEDAQWVVKSRVQDQSYQFLYGSDGKDKYMCKHISLKDAVDKIDQLVYGTTKTWPTDREEALRMNLKYFYKIKKESLTQDDVINCLLNREGVYYTTAYCNSDAIMNVTNKYGTNEPAGYDNTGYGFSQFIFDKYKGQDYSKWFGDYTDEQAFFIASELQQILINGQNNSSTAQYYSTIEVTANEYNGVGPNEFGKRTKDKAIYYKVLVNATSNPQWKYYKYWQKDGKAQASYPAKVDSSSYEHWYTSFMRDLVTENHDFTLTDIFMDSEKMIEVGNAIIKAREKQDEDNFNNNLDDNSKACQNEYSNWKTQYLSAWYMTDPAPPQEWKDKAQQKYKEIISEVEAAHPLTDLYLLNDNSKLVKEGTNDAPNVLWFGPYKIKIDRTKSDDPNRCLKKYYEEAIDKKFREWVNEEAAAATEKQKEAITKKLSDACAKNFKSWLNALYANNGANSTLYTPGSPTTTYTEESQAQRDKINAAVSKAFGYGNNTLDKWLDRIFIEPNTHTAIIRDWEHGGTPGTANTHSGGTYGNCQACLFIEMASESLQKNAPDIKVPVYEEGGCTNPQPNDFNDDGGTWIPPSVVVPIDDYDPIDYEPIVIDDTYDYTNTPNEGPEYAPDTCYAGSGSLGWILCPLIAGASSVGEELWEQIETYHLKLPANALFGSIGGTGESGIHIAWSKIRDIANIVFIIVLLIIVLSQVTGAGISNYGIKKMLPKLLVCIIFVNLSYILCQIAVDVSNTIGSSIGNFLQDIARQIPWTIADVSNNSDGGLLSGGFITILLIGGAAGGIFALIAGMKNGNGAGSLIGGLGLLVLGIVIIILVAIITLYVTLMIREAAVVVCIAIAPLAIVCNVLPNTQPLFKKWFSLMKALLVLYPVSSFMVGGGQLAGAILASTGLNTMRLAAGVVQVIPYFFVPTLLKKSLAGLGNIGAKIGGLGKGLGRKASHGATGAIRNSRRYQDMLAASRGKAENRFNNSKARRLSRKKQRLEGRGRSLSDEQELQLQDALGKTEQRRAAIEAARLGNEADRVAARRAASSAEVQAKDAQLMAGGFGKPEDVEKFTQAKINQARTEAINAKNNTAIAYGGAKLNTDGSLTYNDARAAEANRGYIVERAIQAENSMKNAAKIAQNEAMYKKAKLLEGEVDRKNQMDKLAVTYGGASYDDETGQVIKNSDGSYVTDNAQARQYAAGARSYAAIANRKDAMEKIDQSEHAASLFKAAATKSDIDRANQIRGARAFSEDMDANGNFVPKGTGVYTSDAYAQNYRTTETNKMNSTLASGHTAPTQNPFSDAKTTYQQKANNELFQSYETSFANTSTNDLLKMRTDMMNSFNPANTGSIQKAAALANALFKSKNEDLAQDLLANVTSKVDLPQLQELMRSVDPGEVSGVKGYKTAVLNASEAVAYNDYVNGTIKLQTNPTTGKDEPVMLSMAAQAAKKDGGVTSMDPDTIKYVESQVKNIPSGTNQTVISGAQVLHNILNSNKESAQTSMATILDKTESVEFDNLGISGNDILNIKFDKVGQEKLKNLASIADKNTNFEDSMKKIVASITEEKKSSMDPNTYAALVSKYGGGAPNPQPQPQHPNADGGRYYNPNGSLK